MKRIALFLTLAVLGVFLSVSLAGCAVTGPLFGPTPEAQIVNGANSITAAATAGTVLLKNNKITVAQARGYRAILGTADDHLKDADKSLLACRAKTGSTSKTRPDPCEATVTDDIALAVSVAGDVQKTLDAKK